MKEVPVTQDNIRVVHRSRIPLNLKEYLDPVRLAHRSGHPTLSSCIHAAIGKRLTSMRSSLA